MNDTKMDLKSRALFAHMESLSEQERREAERAAQELADWRKSLTHALKTVFQVSAEEAEAAISPDATYAMLDGVYIMNATYTKRDYSYQHGDTVDVKCLVWFDHHDGKGARRQTVRYLSQFGELLTTGGGQLVNPRTYVGLWRGEDDDYQEIRLTRAEADALLATGQGWKEGLG